MQQRTMELIRRRALLCGVGALPRMMRAAETRIAVQAAHKLEPGIFATATVYNLGDLRPDDPVLVRLMRAIRPPVLRVPGGNTMNLWDWNTGAARTSEQLARFGATPGQDLGAASAAGRQAYLNKMGGPMTAERWAGLAREGGAEPLWGLNVSTMAPEENRTFLLYLKKAGLPARLFELGNELYLSQNWGKEVPTVEDYIRQAKAHAKEVRAVFSNARVAVCVNPNDDRVTAPLVKAAPDRFKPAPLNAWNAALQKESFYDAVVIHLYFRPSELKGLTGVTAQEFANWANVRCSGFSIDEILAWTERTFPGREIWATEWNLNNKTGRGARTYPYLPQHTMLHGLFTASFLLHAASAGSKLTIANYWQLNGGREFGLIGDAPYRERPPYHVFRMLSPAIHECGRIARLDLAGAPVVRGPRQFEVMEAPQVAGFALFNGDELRYLAFVNFGEEAFPVHAGSVSRPGAKAKIECLTAPELLPGWNNPRNPAPDQWNPKYDVREGFVDSSSFSLEPRSFSVISM
jgi:hypothetical protein